MDKLYQYQINEEILSAKYIFPRETVRMEKYSIQMKNFFFTDSYQS